MKHNDNLRTRRRDYLSGEVSKDEREQLKAIQLQRGHNLARGLAILCLFIGGFWMLLCLMIKGQLSIPPNHHALVIERTIFGDKGPRLLSPGNHVIRKKSTVVMTRTGNINVSGSVSRKPGLGARALSVVLPGKEKAQGIEVRFDAAVLLTTNHLLRGIGPAAVKEAFEKGLAACAVSPLTDAALYPEAARKSVTEALSEKSLTLASIEFRPGARSESITGNSVAVHVEDSLKASIERAPPAAFKAAVSFTALSVAVLLLSTVAIPWFWVGVAGLFLVSSLPDEVKRRTAERVSNNGSCLLDACGELCSCSLDLIDLCTFGLLQHTAKSGECSCGAHECDCGGCDCGPCECGGCDCGGCDVPGCDC